jgi:hypothetical protein
MKEVGSCRSQNISTNWLRLSQPLSSGHQPVSVFNSYSQWVAKSLRIFSLCVPCIVAFSQNLPPELAKASGPELLSFDELKELASTAEPSGTLADDAGAK